MERGGGSEGGSNHDCTRDCIATDRSAPVGVAVAAPGVRHSVLAHPGGNQRPTPPSTRHAMVRTDILLDDDSIDAVPNTGLFNLMTDLDAAPDIRLSPDTATLHLGGGDGSTSAGSANLYTDDGSRRIQVATGRTVPSNEAENAVFAGSDDGGTLQLGTVGESDSRVTLDGESSQLWLGNDADSGRMTLYRGGAGVPQHSTISLDGDDAAVWVGGGRPDQDAGQAGSLTVQNRENEPAVSLAGRDDETGHDGGSIRLSNQYDQETVAIESDPDPLSGGAMTVRNGSGWGTISLEANPTGSSGGPDIAGGLLGLASNDGEQTVAIEGANPDGWGGAIRLANGVSNAPSDDLRTETVTIEGGAVGQSGSLTLSNFDGDDRVSLVSTRDTHGSKISLLSGSETESVVIHGDDQNANGGRIDVKPKDEGGDVSIKARGGSGGGAVSVENDDSLTTVDADGGTGELTLGRTGSGSDASENGGILLDDGNGEQFAVEANDGTVAVQQSGSGGDVALELEPGTGEFSVLDGDGDPVFRIDTQDERIEFAKGYSRGTIGGGQGGSGGTGGA